MKMQQQQKGQALVLIVLAIIGLFAFAALAVDGGMLYAERRRAQNAADSAAMAAALAGVQGQNDTQIAALVTKQLQLNGVDMSNAVISVHRGPDSGPYAGNPDYYQVKIESQYSPIFSQFIFSQGLRLTTQAVVHGYWPSVSAQPTTGTGGGGSGPNPTHTPVPTNTPTPVNYGNMALYAIGAGTDTFRSSGNVTLRVHGGGGIYSNDGFTINGGSGDIVVDSPGKIVVRNLPNATQHFSGVSPDPIRGTMNWPVPNAPVCPSTAGTDVTTGNGSKETHTLSPGVFSSMPGKGTVNLNPGIYCLDDGWTINGGVEVNGTGVTFVLRHGHIKFPGNGQLRLSAPTATGPFPATSNLRGVPGLLVYVPTSNTDVHSSDGITLIGTSDSWYYGMTYAPNAECEIGGNAGLQYHSILICNHFRAHGNPTIDVWYYGDAVVPQMPTPAPTEVPTSVQPTSVVPTLMPNSTPQPVLELVQ